MKFSRTVCYAVQAVLLLAESDPSAPVPCRELAARGRMPERFLLQILRQLVHRGIVRSTRGTEGGYTLARSLSSVSLLDVIEAVSGPLEITVAEDTGLPKDCHTRLLAALERVSHSSRRQFEAIKLAQLAPPGANTAKA
jgi:Rrf2 family protein